MSPGSKYSHLPYAQLSYSQEWMTYFRQRVGEELDSAKGDIRQIEQITNQIEEETAVEPPADPYFYSIQAVEGTIYIQIAPSGDQPTGYELCATTVSGTRKQIWYANAHSNYRGYFEFPSLEPVYLWCRAVNKGEWKSAYSGWVQYSMDDATKYTNVLTDAMTGSDGTQVQNFTEMQMQGGYSRLGYTTWSGYKRWTRIDGENATQGYWDPAVVCMGPHGARIRFGVHIGTTTSPQQYIGFTLMIPATAMTGVELDYDHQFCYFVGFTNTAGTGPIAIISKYQLTSPVLEGTTPYFMGINYPTDVLASSSNLKTSGLVTNDANAYGVFEIRVENNTFSIYGGAAYSTLACTVTDTTYPYNSERKGIGFFRCADQWIQAPVTPTIDQINYTGTATDNIDPAWIAVDRGGTGNYAFSDGQLLMYDSSLNMIVSSGYSTAGKGSYQLHHGFADRTETTIALDAGTRTVSLAPTSTSWTIWIEGKPWVKTSSSVVLAATTGLHYVYYDSDAELRSSTSAWDITSSNLPVATVYWNGSAGAIIDERHGYRRNLDWHEWAHDTIGTRYESGLAGTFGNSTFSIALGVIHDEDLDHTITPAKTACRAWYRSSGAFTFEDNVTTPYKAVAGVLKWDNGTNLADVDAGKYINSWFYACGDPTYPIWMVVGQAQYTTLAAAQAATPPGTGSLPAMELKLLYAVIYRYSGGTITYQDTRDFRVAVGPAVSFAPVDHGSLSGLGDDDHVQYLNTTRADALYISLVSTPTAGNFPTLTAGGELANSAYGPTSFADAGHTHDLDDLGDVSAAAPTDGDVLTWDEGTSSWIAAEPTGGGTIDGSGTGGKIAKWSDADTLADSICTEVTGPPAVWQVNGHVLSTFSEASPCYIGATGDDVTIRADYDDNSKGTPQINFSLGNKGSVARFGWFTNGTRFGYNVAVGSIAALVDLLGTETTVPVLKATGAAATTADIAQIVNNGGTGLIVDKDGVAQCVTAKFDHIAEKTAGHNIVFDNNIQTTKKMLFSDDLTDTINASVTLELQGDATAEVTMFLNGVGTANPGIYIGGNSLTYLSYLYMDYSTGRTHLMNALASTYVWTADIANSRMGINEVAPSSTLDVGGDIETTSTGAFYFGAPTTDGTWKMVRDGNDIAFYRRESGSYVEKGRFTA